eukprot:13545451-Alexandrium_andersonii.AAC.1
MLGLQPSAAQPQVLRRPPGGWGLAERGLAGPPRLCPLALPGGQPSRSLFSTQPGVVPSAA